jgi:hypothetical protein
MIMGHRLTCMLPAHVHMLGLQHVGVICWRLCVAACARQSLQCTGQRCLGSHLLFDCRAYAHAISAARAMCRLGWRPWHVVCGRCQQHPAAVKQGAGGWHVVSHHEAYIDLVHVFESAAVCVIYRRFPSCSLRDYVASPCIASLPAGSTVLEHQPGPMPPSPHSNLWTLRNSCW